MPPLSASQLSQAHPTNTYPDEGAYLEVDQFTHSSNLPFPAFRENKLQVCRPGLPDAGRTQRTAVQRQPMAKPLKRRFSNVAVDTDVIFLLYSALGPDQRAGDNPILG